MIIIETIQYYFKMILNNKNSQEIKKLMNKFVLRKEVAKFAKYFEQSIKLHVNLF